MGYHSCNGGIATVAVLMVPGGGASRYTTVTSTDIVVKKRNLFIISNSGEAFQIIPLRSRYDTIGKIVRHLRTGCLSEKRQNARNTLSYYS